MSSIVETKNYKWVALTNTTIGMLMVTINSSILLIALPNIFRGIKLNPLSPGNTSYFLWILMGFLLVTSVLVVSLGPRRRHLRPGEDVHPRIRHLHGLLRPAVGHLDDRPDRRDLDHPHAPGPGGGRGVHLRQLERHHHRRLPGRRAGLRPRDQRGGGHRRAPSSDSCSVACSDRSSGTSSSWCRCRSGSSGPCGPTSGSTTTVSASPPASTGSATSSSPSVSSASSPGSSTASNPTAVTPWAGPAPSCCRA